MSAPDNAREALLRIRWNAELGANGFDNLEPELAAWKARMSLRSIVEVLDDFDHSVSLAKIFEATSATPRFNLRKPASERAA